MRDRKSRENSQSEKEIKAKRDAMFSGVLEKERLNAV